MSNFSPITGDATLKVATGNQVAHRLDYTVNKATSGNDTGLVVNRTDTASPGTSILVGIHNAGASVFEVGATGSLGIGVAVTANKFVNIVAPAAGDKVLEYSTVHSGTDPQTYVLQTRITTTGATPETAQTIAVPTSGIIAIRCRVGANGTGGGGIGGSYERHATYKNRSDMLSLVGSVTDVHTHEDDASWDVTFADDGGTNVLIKVTGSASTDITWTLETWVSTTNA